MIKTSAATGIVVTCDKLDHNWVKSVCLLSQITWLIRQVCSPLSRAATSLQLHSGNKLINQEFHQQIKVVSRAKFSALLPSTQFLFSVRIPPLHSCMFTNFPPRFCAQELCKFRLQKRLAP